MSTDFIVAVIILIVIEQRFRESDINLVKEFFQDIQVFLSVFIPLRNFRFFIYLQRVPNKFYLENFNQYYIRRPIDEVVEKSESNLIIIGKTGTGKTSILIRTFIYKINKALKNKDCKIPVLINSCEVRNSLKESLQNEISNYSLISEKNFDAYLKKGNFSFILDDVFPDFRPMVWSDIVKFVEKYPLCQYVFTTQRIDKDKLSELKNFKVVEILPLTDIEINEFFSRARKYYKIDK